MKNLLAIVFVLAAAAAFSQNVKLHVKKGDTAVFVVDKIVATSDDQIFGQKENYFFHDIKAVLFYEQPGKGTEELIQSKGVTVVDRYSSDLYAGEQKQVARQFDDQYISGPKAKSSGELKKVMQVLGAGLLTGSIVLFASEVDTDLPIDEQVEKYKSRRETVRGLAIAGGVTISIGFLID